MRSLCVFCGSSTGSDPAYEKAARTLGITLAEEKLRLIFGGGRVGLMGAVADAAIDSGGEVTGVIPRSLLEREISHTGLTDLRIVGSMHERKALMSDLSDGFIALPGGTGTLEEFFEVLTWAQLGEHGKPCGLLNVAGYYDPSSPSSTTWSSEASSRSSTAGWCSWRVNPRRCLTASPATGRRQCRSGSVAQRPDLRSLEPRRRTTFAPPPARAGRRGREIW